MSEIAPTSSLQDVCFIVGTALAENDIIAVLTGGSAATVYSHGRYQSYDADFVLRLGGDLQRVRDIMASLGFIANRTGEFTHPATTFSVDFPAGPLAVGVEFVTTWETLVRETQTLHVLSPTDCVRDRLAAFYYWNDRSALETAVAVARVQHASVDLDVIASWTAKEERASFAFRQREKYATFARLLQEATFAADDAV
jgi:hypothetical protein